MSLKLLSHLFVAQSLLLSVSSAASYFSDFDSIPGNASLSGADGWVTNDPYVPAGNFGQTDYVGIISGYSQTLTDNWALLGGATGFTPGQSTVYLWRPVDLTGASGASFTVGSMAVISSALPRLSADTFGWTFRDSSDNTLFSLRFDPETDGPLGDLNIRMYNSSGTEFLAAGSGDWDIYYNSIYSLNVSVSSSGLVDVSFTDANSITTQAITGAATGINPASISGVAATWVLDSPGPGVDGTPQTGFGSNSLVFDNYGLVPEPSSTLLLGVAGLGLALRRRRA